MRLHGDERGVIISWLVKIVLFLAVAGVVLFDAGSILVNNVTLDSSSDDLAIAVSLIVDTGIPNQYTDVEVWQLAKDTAKRESITGVRVIQNGTEVDDEGVVHIHLRRKAKTLVAKYIPPLEDLTVANVSGQAGIN